MAERIELIVDGFRFAAWKSIRITRSIENVAGQFSLATNDRWTGDEDPWQIAEEDACRVEINGAPVIDGWVDKRNTSGSKDGRAFSCSGRDKASALVDNSVELERWTFHSVNVVDFVRTIAAPWGISVSVQAGLVLPKVAKLVVEPGSTAYEAIKKTVADSGALVVSDGKGGIAITRSGTERATPLIEGGDLLLDGNGSYDGQDRYYRYVLMSQTGGTDEAYGERTKVLAEAIDEGCRRTDRVLVIHADTAYTVEEARRRIDWEARIRAAKADAVTATVRGWSQPDGRLWSPNAKIFVRSPKLCGVEGELLITQVDHTVSEKDAPVSTLRLMRPDVFSPEPKAATVKASGGRWKEISDGAKNPPKKAPSGFLANIRDVTKKGTGL